MTSLQWSRLRGKDEIQGNDRDKQKEKKIQWQKNNKKYNIQGNDIKYETQGRKYKIQGNDRKKQRRKGNKIDDKYGNYREKRKKYMMQLRYTVRGNYRQEENTYILVM